MKTLRELSPPPSLLDKRFVYFSAATHGDPEAFRMRMQMYAQRGTWKPIPANGSTK